MWLSFFALVLILAMTFYQGLLGLFSSVIMCILTILSAAVAFGYYENIYYAFLIERMPEDGRGVALIALFAITLLVLRLIYDLIITKNMEFPVYLDRIGGGILGLVTAMIIVGTLTTAIQMLSFDSTFLGFSRYNIYNADGTLVSLEPQEEDKSPQEVLKRVDFTQLDMKRQNLWLNPDGFTVSLVSLLSANALQGEQPLERVHPKLLDELHYIRFNPAGQKVNVALSTDAVRAETAWTLASDELYVREETDQETTSGRQKIQIVELTPPKDPKVTLPDGFKWLAVRVKLSDKAIDDQSTFRFVPQQVQLITEGGQAYPLAGINVVPENLVSERDRRENWHERVYPGQPITRTQAESKGRFDFVFEIPADAEPWFIQFKLNARAAVPPVVEEAPPPLLANQPEEAADGPDAGGRDRTGDRRATRDTDRPDGSRRRRVSGVHSDLAGSFFSNELPVQLVEYNAQGVETSSSTIVGGTGRIVANLDQQPESPGRRGLTEFQVARGQALLQLSAEQTNPQSWLGNIFASALRNQNVSVVSDRGRQYPAIGMYAIADTPEGRIIEIVYFDETSRMSQSAIPKLERIKRDDLRNDYALYYLFQVPAGEQVTEFVNPEGGRENLAEQNLVAPRQ